MLQLTKGFHIYNLMVSVQQPAQELASLWRWLSYWALVPITDWSKVIQLLSVELRLEYCVCECVWWERMQLIPLHYIFQYCIPRSPMTFSLTGSWQETELLLRDLTFSFMSVTKPWLTRASHLASWFSTLEEVCWIVLFFITFQFRPSVIFTIKQVR